MNPIEEILLLHPAVKTDTFTMDTTYLTSILELGRDPAFDLERLCWQIAPYMELYRQLTPFTKPEYWGDKEVRLNWESFEGPNPDGITCSIGPALAVASGNDGVGYDRLRIFPAVEGFRYLLTREPGICNPRMYEINITDSSIVHPYSHLHVAFEHYTYKR